MPQLDVVVACTNRKRLPAKSALLMRHIHKRSISDKFNEWVRRVEECSSSGLRATDMYSGEYWSVIRSLKEREQQDISLWVASAGYGLIPIDAPIKPYSASLSPSPDCVANGLKGASRLAVLAEWWRLLSTWNGPARSTPRRLETLAMRSPSTTLMIVASADYVAAMAEDIRAAVTKLERPENLIIVSTGIPANLQLAGHCVPVSARLLYRFGGSRVSLNARTAFYLLNKLYKQRLDLQTASRALKRLIARQPANRVFDRHLRTDDEVKAFISTEFANAPGCSQSRLLRKFRDSGNACEYSRFARIFEGVMEENEA